MIIVLLGVSGSGKTTVGLRLAEALGWPFYDADDFHPEANVAKMREGQPLTDADRLPWLDRLRALIGRLSAEGQAAVLACSALKRAYRRHLQPPGADVRFVYLKGSFDLIHQRITARQGHFMDPDLLRSQFETLEPPEEGLAVSIDQSPASIVQDIRKALDI